MARRVGVGIAHAGKDDAVGRVDHLRPGRHRQPRPHRGNAVAFDEDIRPLEPRRRPVRT